ncbi:MAG: threonine aldolase family protein, partial [Opitutaceae bacterium]
MISPDQRFASDNASGLCPEARDALIAANEGAVAGYGDDPFTAGARAGLRRLFETECEAFFVFNGTAANALALAALCRPHESVLCHEEAHVHTDECAAPEFFGGGLKLVPLSGAAGKIDPKAIAGVAARGHGVHSSKPGVLSLTQATEWGTAYSPAEIRLLCARAGEHGLRIHMDGARFANAVAASAAAPAELTWRAGVDVL